MEETTYGDRRRFEFLCRVIETTRPRLVLDIGCGTGMRVTRPLAEAFPAICFVGTDRDHSSIAWASDNKTFDYIIEDGSKNSLWRQSLDNDQPRLIADLGNEEIEDFALSPDDSTFAFIRGKWIHDAVLIEGLK